MPVTTYTLTGDFSALVGEVSKIRATVHANGEDDSWVNETDLKVILGGALLSVNETGAFTASLPTSTGTGLQYEVRAEYVDEATRRRNTWRSGWFDLTANGNLATLANDSSLRVNPSLGDVLAGRIDDNEDRLDALEAGGGTEALADRVDGVDDHGTVSGTLLLNPAKGFHVFDATGPTTVELGNPPGRSIAFQAVTGADEVTVEGLDDLGLTDGAWASFVYFRDAWHLASAGASGGGSVEPVTDPPTQPGTVTVTPTSDGFDLSWVASTVAAGYEVQIDGGAWFDSGAGTTHSHAGLAAGSSHSGAIRAYNSLGAKSTARAWGPASVESVGLHEQLLAYDAPIYLRLSRGSLEQFGTSVGSWTNSGGVTFNGPALMEGEVGSAAFAPGKYLKRAMDSSLNNAEKVSLVMFVSTAPDLNGSNRATYVDGIGNFLLAGGQGYYDSHAEPHVFVITIDRSGGGNTVVSYRDGVERNMTSAPSWQSATIGGEGVWINGWQHGGNDGAFYLSHLMLLPGELLTQTQAQSLAAAAGTIGNSA